MKQRITYLVNNPKNLERRSLKVEGDSFGFRGVAAAKEHRLTFSLSELPQELYRVLKQCHELHIRWASEIPYAANAPFVARTSPGLHVFFTPQRNGTTDLVCPMLKKVFGEDLNCDSPKETFTGMPILSERFTQSASSQYYQLLPSLDNFMIYVQQKFCHPQDSSCMNRVGSLLSATYLDIDYDTISHALVVSPFWAHGPTSELRGETISLRPSGDTIEIGVLTNEKAGEAEDISLSGFLTVLGKDDKPKPTRFSFPSRHHTTTKAETSSSHCAHDHDHDHSTHSSSHPPLTYLTTFAHPTGLHPNLLLTLPRASLSPPDQTCSLHAHLTLPSYLFIDKYQFQDPLFLASKNLIALRSLSGATDLEAPDWVIPEWGSAALFELAIPEHGHPSKAEGWEISIPLHLRYLPPNANSSGLEEVQVPWPVVFWACRSDEAFKMNTNPFDRVHLGYEALFGPKTMFYHVPPRLTGQKMVETIQVPVLDLDKAYYVEYGTAAAVMIGVLWLLWKLFGGLAGKGKAMEEEEKKKKKKKQ